MAGILLNDGGKKECARSLMMLFYFLSGVFALSGAFPFVNGPLMQNLTL